MAIFIAMATRMYFLQLPLFSSWTQQPIQSVLCTKSHLKKELCREYTSEFEALKLIHGHKAVLNDVIDHMIRARKLLTEACYHTLK